jgi:hypothetical protein
LYKNSTKPNTILQQSTQLQKTSQNIIKLYIFFAKNNATKLYKTLHNLTQIYNTLENSTHLSKTYKTLHIFTTLNQTLQHFTQLDQVVQSSITLYNGLQHFYKKKLSNTFAKQIFTNTQTQVSNTVPRLYNTRQNITKLHNTLQNSEQLLRNDNMLYTDCTKLCNTLPHCKKQLQ